MLVAVSAVGLVPLGRRLRADVVAAVVATALLTVLGGLFLAGAWSWAYVADHARPGTGPLLRLAGLWAGAEGSLLLWVTLTAWAAVAAGRLAPPAHRATVGALGAALTTGYALVLALTASPFERPPVPAASGVGLQPVLEHPAMVWHPPLLYGGLVGLLVPFLLVAGAALGPAPVRAAARPGPEVGGRAGGAHPGFVVPRVALALPLALLTAGLVTGALWANVELGWGGFWAWDPIESAGLVAWLAGAAALHGRASQALGPGTRAAVALALAPGLAAVGATTLTRIGVVASVHAFADRPALRVGLLAVAAATVAVAALAVVRAPGSAALRVGTAVPGRVVRGRRAAVVVLVVATVFVAVGTYEPAVEAATTGDRLAIAGRYFSRLLWPVVIVGSALAVGADRRWVAASLGAGAGLAVTPWAAGPYALAVGAAGGAVALSALAAGSRLRPGALAHAGVGVALIGVAGTMATTSTVVNAPTGRAIDAAGLLVTHESIELVDGVGTRSAVATVTVDGVRYRPRLVTFERRGVATAEVDRRRSGLDEVQVVLLDGDARSARYRVNRLPRLHLLWWGSALIVVALPGQVRRRLRASSSDTVEPPSESPSPSPSPSPGAGPVVGGAEGASGPQG